MKRRLLVGAVLAVAAALIYTAAGYWLAPRLLIDALEERAAQLGLALGIDDVHTDPFRLTASFFGVELVGRGGNRLASADEVRVDLAWASLWRDHWVVQRASLHSPYLEVVRGPDGEIDWPRPESRPQGAGGGPAAIRVRSLSISEGTLRILDRSRAAPVELVAAPLRMEVENLSTGGGEAQYRLEAGLERNGALSSAGTFSLAPLAAHGEVEVSNASLAQAWRLAAPASPPSHGALSARAAYAYEEGRLVLRDFYAEAREIAYEGLRLYRASVESPELALPTTGAVTVSAQAQLDPSGSLSARGTVDPGARSAALDIEALSLPLPLAERFLPETVALDVASGALSGKGRLSIDKARTAYQGSAQLAGLELEEADSERLLLAWKLARTDTLRFSSSPLALEMGELVVQAPRGRLVIEDDGSVNLGSMFRGEDGGGEPLALRVGRLAIENGTLDFADRSLETPFEVTIRELGGAVTGFTTAKADPAQLALEGRVGEYGAARIRGTIELDDPAALANIRARFRNVDLAQLTPYVVRFAGYRVESGRVSADLRYRVREGRLVGQNQLVFSSLELGEKVRGAGAPDLPLELAVALLADASGRITLDIPVRGNLNDPQFDFGGLIARAIGGAVRKIVSAPFRALAGVFSGGKAEALDAVRFEAGSAELAPPQEEAVAKIAEALAARPQLGVIVHGGYDAERDAQALRMDAVRNEIARRAGYKPGGPLDLGDPNTLHAAERLYLERIGNRSDLRALQKEAPRYGRALVELLAYTLPGDAGDAEKLALERAHAVRAALLERGIAPQRVAVEASTAQAAGEEGVPTRLALTADIPKETDTVAQAQRALREAGVDPGAVDGKLGPKTRDALRRFQQARGLEASGELDPRTLAALGVRDGAAAGATAAP